MSGNEIALTEYLINNIGAISLDHLGLVTEVGAPVNYGEYTTLDSISQLHLVKDNDSSKKADIYINGSGISVKQHGGSFSFNRIQRATVINLLTGLGIENASGILHRLDNEIHQFHNNDNLTRNRPWQNIFSEDQFYIVLKYLMMYGSPNYGDSSHPADFILDAPAYGISEHNISVMTFDEYFSRNREKFMIALRRQWIGQNSNSEHGRATSLANKPGNEAWVFKTISGSPRSGWRTSVAEEDRRTVYFLMLEKIR